MKPVERQHNIKALIFERQCADIALQEGDIFDPCIFRLFLCRRHHILRIVQARDVRIRKIAIDRHGKYAGPDRDL